ncbi:hypothetical protein EJ06DRAFT_287658 [Trichodelitschia bisporula]|uniref:Uncharacterized protein n=1 Tax=Trichodelitschia bisporula TaxID=703511 RepID=A0A6G1I655_9PEZI|nr:hypothetical protein EJ06DRAFT_287658 [Trichodelitschia bisporula]
MSTSPDPTPSSPTLDHLNSRRRTNTSSSTSSRLRSASVRVLSADVPHGMWAATGTVLAKTPAPVEIRKGSFGPEGWTESGQRHNSVTSANGKSKGATVAELGVLHEPERPSFDTRTAEQTRGLDPMAVGGSVGRAPEITEDPHLPWTQSTTIALRAFWKWFTTPLGFFITIYGLNVVAWGGMLFLLLCNASPAMCKPNCNDINSPRRVWIEIDSQILNALFCVTGFGLIPWRFRDLYWLLVWRWGIRGHARKEEGMRRLAGIHRGWFRLRGSEHWEDEGDEARDLANPAVPLPLDKRLDGPVTGIRAPPTATWRMDYVVWCAVWNTFLQAVLCGFMWGMNRYDRPSWSTGLFVAMACIVAGLGGIMMFMEGKKVKKVEGVPPKGSSEMEKLAPSPSTRGQKDPMIPGQQQASRREEPV